MKKPWPPRTCSDSFLSLLLATDAVLIVFHLVYFTTSILQRPIYDLQEEAGLGEAFQYFKAYWIVLMFLFSVATTRERGYLAWALAFAYLGLDDALEIHERLGYRMESQVASYETPLVRVRDLGELGVLAIAGAVLLAVIALAYVRGSATFRRRSKALIVMSTALAIFGIAIDFVHVALDDTMLNTALGTAEDGGEMIILSFICWYVFRNLSIWREHIDDDQTTGRPCLSSRALR